MTRSRERRLAVAAESKEKRDAANDRTAIEYPLRVRIAELEREAETQRRRADRAEVQRSAYKYAAEILLAAFSRLDTGKDG